MHSINRARRQWDVCLCPKCRGAFRVPKKRDGIGVVCPACKQISKLPDQGSESHLEPDKTGGVDNQGSGKSASEEDFGEITVESAVMDWEKIFEQRSTNPQTIRVNTKLESEHNPKFEDHELWVVVNLSHPQSERILYGYIDRKNVTLEDFPRFLKGKVAQVPLRIQCSANEGAENQVIITEVLSYDWLNAEGKLATE